MAKIEISPLSTGHSCTTLRVKNSLEIALSLMVFEIFVIFDIFTKSSNKVAITHLLHRATVVKLKYVTVHKKVHEQDI